MKNYLRHFIFASCLCGCHSARKTPRKKPSLPLPPVTVSPVESGLFLIHWNSTQALPICKNNYVKSSAAGYIKSVLVKPGDLVDKGKTLFTLETKESAAIGQTITSLDSSFKFSGLITIQAKGHGYITQLNHQSGDYVQDGEQLAVISDQNSFVFILNMPYEDRNIVLKNKTVYLTLPDKTRLTGTIGTVFPNVDSLTQTQMLQ
jgi:multidrug efflux pump subunit AcrA (membrane-fusion protein)